MLNRYGRALLIVAALGVLVVPVSTASAAVLLNSKGWQISMPDWVTTNSGASIVEDPGDPNTLVIQITKNFRGQLDQFGLPPSIIMSFTQTAPDANTATRIIINDESVTNSTNFRWDMFHYALFQMGYAAFNHAATFPGDFGGNAANNFFTDQYTQHSWTTSHPDSANPTTWTDTLNLSGGTVPIGGLFSPGSASGALVIDVDLTSFDGTAANGFFTFKEYPEAPEPATMALLALGGAALLRRRRRA